jgi:putative DNA primase/helicase
MVAISARHAGIPGPAVEGAWKKAMIPAPLRDRIEEAKRRAQGGWKPILERLGVDPGILEGRNQPCPACGGKDRFQFTDKYGDGNYICRGCGPGDGFALLELCRGWKFIDALKAVEGAVGSASASAPPAGSGAAAQRMRQLAARIWQEAKPVEAGDAVATYLARRGIALAAYPQALRTHPALGFYVRTVGESRARPVRTFPAMLATVQGPDGCAVSLHRTYLEQGAKAPVAECKKLLNGGIAGAAVRLFEPTDELAIAEGIETALAVHVSTGKPVWAALSATNMAKLWIPASVKNIGIYADHDASYTGQAAAYALAKRIKSQERGSCPREVTVCIPGAVDSDWADVLHDRVAQAA